MAENDPLPAALAEAREAITAVPAEFGTLPLNEARASFAAGMLWGTAGKLLAAVDAVLKLHAPTALVRYTEACPAHYASMSGRLECPDCVKVRRNGCETCRDGYGNPARPEDCKERAAILAALTGEEKAGG